MGGYDTARSTTPTCRRRKPAPGCSASSIATLLPQAAESQDDTADTGGPEGGSPAEDDADPTASAAASVQRDVAQIRSEQCQQAQQQYKTYVESRRLYRQTADGKREYLTDAELTAARIQAKQDVDDLCK